jgi:hypothetical protein
VVCAAVEVAAATATAPVTVAVTVAERGGGARRPWHGRSARARGPAWRRARPPSKVRERAGQPSPRRPFTSAQPSIAIAVPAVELASRLARTGPSRWWAASPQSTRRYAPAADAASPSALRRLCRSTTERPRTVLPDERGAPRRRRQGKGGTARTTNPAWPRPWERGTLAWRPSTAPSRSPTVTSDG